MLKQRESYFGLSLLVSAKNLEAFSKTLFSRTAKMQGVYMPHYRGKAAE